VVEGSLTSILAIWGAGLSTFVVLRDWWRSLARARVRVRYSAVDSDNVPDRSPFVLVATISNHGKESIYLEQAGMQTDTGMSVRQGSFVDSLPLPIDLRPGQSYTAKFEADTAWAISSYGTQRRVRVIFYDQLSREYTSPFISTGKSEAKEGHWSLSTPKPANARWIVRLIRRRSLPSDN
jgi:hypothetical protein